MRALLLCLWLLMPGSAIADRALVAVAANFLTTAEELVARFEEGRAHRIELVSGATGVLYAQISQGAPYDVFLSADQASVAELEASGLLLVRRSYAEGRLVLWSPDPDLLKPDAALSLEQASTRHFAMADPAVAPYGRAAREVIAALGLQDLAADKAVIGASVGQAFAFVATGNAEMGFVALSQVIDRDGAWYQVPAGLHAPILQDAGLLIRARDNPAAQDFFAWLAGPEARGIIARAGYGGGS